MNPPEGHGRVDALMPFAKSFAATSVTIPVMQVRQSIVDAMLKQAGQDAPKTLPILEVNSEHALVKRLADDERFDDLAHILFDQALLAEGGQLDDPAAYVRRVNALLTA